MIRRDPLSNRRPGLPYHFLDTSIHNADIFPCNIYNPVAIKLEAAIPKGLLSIMSNSNSRRSSVSSATDAEDDEDRLNTTLGFHFCYDMKSAAWVIPVDPAVHPASKRT